MDTTTTTSRIHEDNSADGFAPLESGLHILVGEMPATLVPLTAAMRMDCSDKVFGLPEGSMFGPDNSLGIYLDPIAIGNMIDRSYSGYQEVPLVAPQPMNGSEVLIGVSFAALPPEFSE